jgi:hypothetical protein
MPQRRTARSATIQVIASGASITAPETVSLDALAYRFGSECFPAGGSAGSGAKGAVLSAVAIVVLLDISADGDISAIARMGAAPSS